MRAVALTDVGLKRENNEDYYLIREDLSLYLVADGMGGYHAGEIASEIASKTIASVMEAYENFVFERDIHALLIKANEAILEFVLENPTCKGMGTTVVLVHFTEDEIWVANVGDSRCYGLGNDGLIQLSEDHSLVAELVKIGSISAEEAATHPDRNIVTSALGVDRRFEVFFKNYKRSEFKRILLCSDGMSNMVDKMELEKLTQLDVLESIPQKMIDSANSYGGRDNITVVCIEI